ncbi:hypothetical protein FAM14222_002361 [Propionibacterium freudenreichii]|uniref:hypothetical protein n=1 Tax=Propionibacterium freudenreichii TaxID=1744 RepID=UPI002550B880|nr:hypothetical protein [Propionibacterium freudenreichii]MDK9593942.1 hypothetical protein [Propionibacterium freudenreichii]
MRAVGRSPCASSGTPSRDDRWRCCDELDVSPKEIFKLPAPLDLTALSGSPTLIATT